MNKDNGVDYYGGSAQEAGWYERPSRVVQIIIGGRIVWSADSQQGAAQQNAGRADQARPASQKETYG